MSIKERRLREKKERENVILDAARQEFSKKGFRNSTITDIAARAELSPGALYLYFKSKEDIYTNLSIITLRELTLKIYNLLECNMSPQNKLNALCLVFIEEYNNNMDMMINLCRLQSEESLEYISDATLLEFKKLISFAQDGVTQIIEEGVESNFLVNASPEPLANLIWGYFTGVVLWNNSKSFLKKPQNAVSSYLKIAFDMIIENYRIKDDVTPVLDFA